MVGDAKLQCSRTLRLLTIQLILISAALKVSCKLLRLRGDASFKESKGGETYRFDALFWRRLWSLMRICIPRLISLDTCGAVFYIVLLILRTRLTLKFAQVVGQVGRYLVLRDRPSLLRTMVALAMLSIPGAVLQAGIHYTKIMLYLRLRSNLQQTLQREYLASNNVYTIATRNALDNPDHRITEGVRQFVNQLIDVFRSGLKPLIDVITFSTALAKTGGFALSGFLGGYYILVATIMSATLPNFAQLLAVSQEKEGTLRMSHNQLVQHAEEVAFYSGENLERAHADRVLRSVIRHEAHIKSVKWWMGLIDALLIKYGSITCGYIMCGTVAFAHRDTMSSVDLTELYLRNTQFFIPLSQAIGKLLLLHKKVSALCGSTHRVGELRDTLRQLTLAHEGGGDDGRYVTRAGIQEVVFANVDVVAPNGMVLLHDFSLRIERDVHVLIMGTNGSGKSSLMRILSGLWPVQKGSLTMPELSEVFFLPQCTYLPTGTLRAQMIYPMLESDLAPKGIRDEDLMRYAASMGLSSVVAREGGLDACKNWREVLSGGERQRVALIRVLVHRPLFAFLDECTSAISQDDEPRFYVELQKSGVTLISISHRQALKTVHDVLVEINGEGGYRVSALRGELRSQR